MGSVEAQGGERYAVVTGANKGIGFELVRQLACRGVVVVLTARDEKRGREAASKLRDDHHLHANVIFHQLDVLDPLSIQSLANFIHDSFGRLDILVNNAGASGVVVVEEDLKALNIDPTSWLSGQAVNKVQEALLPLLKLSTGGARIVNVSSLRSELKRIPSEEIRNELGNVEALTEEKVDAILRRFLHDFKENALEANGWTMMLPAYSISKQTLNAYTRILAKKYPKMYINCVHPGFVLSSWLFYQMEDLQAAISIKTQLADF
ncbi:hypothetical protein M0R45_016025 [Rubus argutus]|uniref:(+)-neomenthol dehydrogenase n=1 Tax=Rubus argutus TaxID=59490 RepID=A0AAW1XRB4_RUBAR